MGDMVKDKYATVLIVIPVFNGEKYLKETIESCLHQTYKDIQIVLVNDYSSDSSVDIIEGYRNQKNITVIHNKVNLGINRTDNLGAKAYNSKYLLFLGQDDILPPNYIETALMFFDKHTAFVYCNPIIIDKNAVSKGKIKKEEDIKHGKALRFHMAKENNIMSTGLIISSRMFKDVGFFDEKYKHYGEWKLWIKLMRKGKAVYAKGINTYYRRHLTNISNTFTDNINLTTLKEQHKYWSECRLDAIKGFDFTLMERVQLIYYYVCQLMKYKLEEWKVSLKR